MAVLIDAEPDGAMRRATGRTPRARALRLYAAVSLGLLALMAYAMLRVGLCWGRYGFWGTLLCKMHYIVVATAILGIAVLVVQILELGRLHRARFAGQRFIRSRAAWHGYQQLGGAEATHVSVSASLILLFVAGCVALLVFAPVLF